MLVLGKPWDVDAAVDDGVRHVDAAGAKLPRQRLRDGPRGELARGEVGELCAAPYGGRRARDDQRWRVRRRVDRLEKQGECALGEEEKTVAVRGIVCLMVRPVLSREEKGGAASKGRWASSRIALEAAVQFLELELQEWLDPEGCTHVVDGGG